MYIPCFAGARLLRLILKCTRGNSEFALRYLMQLNKKKAFEKVVPERKEE